MEDELNWSGQLLPLTDKSKDLDPKGGLKSGDSAQVAVTRPQPEPFDQEGDDPRAYHNYFRQR